ncbi:SID1 transmembrane family member 1 [Dissostichus eleginoides]|uniref:SID1 transmembrane family member 1 n=1 Tax=Dissostichus eleginoides TaxID=100907 RepID=A0AAD9C7G8_DISEL|nr:SID1 transmembrane family member 1 [Dissostichus eleginoides]
MMGVLCFVQISRLLTSQYPNLETISGGWLLYKALGGSGQRKLSVIPPETGGYNGHFLKTMQMSFRRCLRRLRVCGSCMPLQVLAAHVKSCVEQPSSGDDFDRGSSPEVTIVAESIPPESPPGTSNTMRPHVEAATDTTDQVLTEEIWNCAYTGLIRMEKKGEIIRYAGDVGA